MPMLEIAAIIPCYNGARFLEGAIESVLRQTRPVARLIVVDDGSTDDSVAIVERFREAGHPVRSIVAERNGGPATARNLGIAAAREPLVAFLDADDRWEPHHCATMAALLEREREAVLAFGRVRTADDEEAAPADQRMEAAPASDARPESLLEVLLYDSPVPQSAAVVRRDALLAVGGYTDGLRHSEDYDLWLRLAHGHPFIRSGATTCTRLMHPAQATHQAMKMFVGAWESRLRYVDFAARHGGLPLGAERYEAICTRAYERDLTWAWQSRSLAQLRGVLAMSPLVPGGDAVRRRWTRRMVALWPLWRSAAYCWDALPETWRRAASAARARGAPSPDPA